jgi:pimeloyl-ACP methyl ester carboxylesterase
VHLIVRGRKVRIATGGRSIRPSYPLVVMLHAAAVDRTAWSLVTRTIAGAGWSVCTPDLPGHGSSAGPAVHSVEDGAAWVAELVEATGHRSAHVAGHSLGSLLALELAATRPDVVDSLMLLGTAATMPVHPDLAAAADAGDHLAIELIAAWGHAEPAHLGRHASPGLSIRDTAIRMMERTAPEVIASDLRAAASYEGAIEAAVHVRCPVLVIAGGLDRMTPWRNAEPLIAALPDVVVEHLPRTGHMMMTEDPHAVADAMLRFLRSSTEA